jgi:hypothetical protein
VSWIGLVSKWIIADGRDVVNNRRDAQFVELSHFLWAELSQSVKRDVDIEDSFKGLLYVFLPP